MVTESERGVVGWRAAVAVLALAGVVLGIALWPTYQSIVVIWMRSETYAHGFIVPLIAIFLIWLLRERLTVLQPRPDFWALVPIGGLGLLWVLGGLVDVDVVRHFAAVLLIPALVWAVLGNSVVRELQFPLAYLLFGVPFGAFLVPPLMDLTADFTVWAVQQSGIPVYREGRSFELPSGRWSIVAACSGVRYLIASLALGTLYAYLVYRSWLRRLIFLAACVVVPIAANAVRAYMIVMIGHLSDMELASGVDHLIYGWLFFGVVIALLFWIGTFWREDRQSTAGGQSDGAAEIVVARQPPQAWGRLAGVTTVAVGLFVAMPLYTQWMNERDLGVVAGLGEGAPVPAGWQALSESASAQGRWQPGYNHARDERYGLVAPRSEAGPTIGLHVSYYRAQFRHGSMIGWENTLAGRERSDWRQRRAGRGDPVPVAGGELPAPGRYLLAGPERRLVVWRWYWVGGHLTLSEHEVKAREAVQRFFGGGDDAALVVLYADYRHDPAEVEPYLRSYAAEALPEVLSSLGEVRGR